MGKFTIEGVDDATGMQTSLVLEATTQDEALKVARSRGIRPRRTEFIPPAFTGQEPASHADIARLVEEIQGLRGQVVGLQEAYQSVLYDNKTRSNLKDLMAWGIVRGLLVWTLLPVFLGVLFLALLMVSSAIGLRLSEVLK